jgi:hypothetical protein
MRRWPVTLGIIAIWPLCGCGLAITGTRNFVNEPRTYLDNFCLSHRARSFAKEAWKTHTRSCPEWAESEAYRDGYIDGYAEFLDLGGPSGPPSVAPRSYWTKRGLTPEGYADMQDYLVGYEAGNRDAIASGQRAFMVVPIAIPATPPQVDRVPIETPKPEKVTPKEVAPAPKKKAPSSVPDKPIVLPEVLGRPDAKIDEPLPIVPPAIIPNEKR